MDRSSSAARQLADLLDRIDRDGAIAAAAHLGEHRPDLAYAVLLGHVTAAARAVLAEQEVAG